MTKDKDFKKLVRTRMLATGENYTTARSTLLAEHATPDQTAEAGNGPTADPQIEQFRTKTLRTFMPDGRITAIPITKIGIPHTIDSAVMPRYSGGSSVHLSFLARCQKNRIATTASSGK